jgi:hypothetical protein
MQQDHRQRRMLQAFERLAGTMALPGVEKKLPDLIAAGIEHVFGLS